MDGSPCRISAYSIRYAINPSGDLPTNLISLVHLSSFLNSNRKEKAGLIQSVKGGSACQCYRRPETQRRMEYRDCNAIVLVAM